MTEADVRRLLVEKKIRTVRPDPETAQVELDVARRHIASAEKIMDDDATLAFTALYDAIRKAIAAHMRSRGYRVARGPGAHAKTGEYALAALDHLDIEAHLDEFDTLRDLRNQSEYEALSVGVDEVREAFEHATEVVDAVARDL
jgi:HEPN domain